MRILTAPCTQGLLTAQHPTVTLANLHTIEGFCDLADEYRGQHSSKGKKWPETVLERIKRLNQGYAWTGPETQVPPRMRGPSFAPLTPSKPTCPRMQKMGRRLRTSGPNRSTYAGVSWTTSSVTCLTTSKWSPPSREAPSPTFSVSSIELCWRAARASL